MIGSISISIHEILDPNELSGQNWNLQINLISTRIETHWTFQFQFSCIDFYNYFNFDFDPMQIYNINSF